MHHFQINGRRKPQVNARGRGQGGGGRAQIDAMHADAVAEAARIRALRGLPPATSDAPPADPPAASTDDPPATNA
jgi:hypothetical protein